MKILSNWEDEIDSHHVKKMFYWDGQMNTLNRNQEHVHYPPNTFP